MRTDPLAKPMLDLAARLAWRGWGRVEPNPMVGAVLVRDGRVIGMGHHRRFGGAHAEVEAFADCARRGGSPKGATLYVTLEPCNGVGKQPPCSRAVIDAGVARVVCARRDPNPGKSGGAEALRGAGIACEFSDASPNATALGAPFVGRLSAGLPWVIAKWAQTIDGKVAASDGESRWISNERSRRWVHLTRGRVDAVVTGIGTVTADDPLLTARGVPVRRVARRVVIDASLQIPTDSALVRTARERPLLVLATERAAVRKGALAGALRRRGAEVFGVPGDSQHLDLRAAMRVLSGRFGVATALLECGPRLTGAMFDAGLIDEAHVYTAPMLLSDQHAPAVGARSGVARRRLGDARRLELVDVRRIGGDVLSVYRRPVVLSPQGGEGV